MPFTTACSKCGAQLQAADTAKGKSVRCKTCGGVFVARPVGGEKDDSPATAAASAKPRPRPAADDLDEDNRPRRPSKASRREEEDEEDDRPRRRSRDKGDEPRSKGKKKDKKKAVRLPVRLFVLIGVGALVLIGGGIAAAVFLSEDGPVEQPVVKAGSFEAPVHDVKGKSGGGAVWVEHADVEGKYRIRFPRQPDAQPLTISEGGLQLTGKTMTVQDGQQVFAISALTLADPNANPETVLNAAEQAAGQISGGANVADKKPVTHAGVAGRELTLTGSGGLGGAVRLFVNNGRLYILRAVGPGYQPTTSNVVNFFESLRFE